MKEKTIYELKGKVITKIEGLSAGSDEIVIEVKSGDRYRMYHYQDCCEYVRVKDIDGDINDILNEKIIKAEEIVKPNLENPYESATSTHFKLTTEKGSLLIKWLGESNGYYSESVAFEQID